MTDKKSELLPRQQFLREYGVTDSSERRARTEGRPWPPHVELGGRIYYRRATVETWFASQERGTIEDRPEPLDVRRLFPALSDEVHTVVAELVAGAPSIEQGQLNAIRTIISGGAA